MCQNKANKNYFDAVSDFADDSIFVAADIENRAVSVNVGVVEGFADIGKIIPIGKFHRFDPFTHCAFRLRVFSPKLPQFFLADYSHSKLKVSAKTIIAYCDIKENKKL